MVIDYIVMLSCYLKGLQFVVVFVGQLLFVEVLVIVLIRIGGINFFLYDFFVIIVVLKIMD